MLWSGGLSAIFFLISKHVFGSLRLERRDEILGGDLHYFGPIEFERTPCDYDTEDLMLKLMKKFMN